MACVDRLARSIAFAPIVGACSAALLEPFNSESAPPALDTARHDQLPEGIKTTGVIKLREAFKSLPDSGANPDNTKEPVGVAPGITALPTDLVANI